MKHTIIFIIITILMTIPSNFSRGESLEVFSWWTAPGEIEGLELIIQDFKKEYPDIDIKNAVIVGGAGVKVREILKTRMLTNDRPDSFQVHVGSELIDTWVKTDYLLPVNDLWENNVLDKYYPTQLQEMVSYDGKYYAVPINIHRSNLLWYNKKIFDKFALSPPDNIENFLKVAETLKDNGVTPLALSSKHKWPITHIFESILAVIGGKEFYQGLIEGNYSWQNEVVIESLKILKEISYYSNNNHNSLSWDQACQMLVDEKAAMTLMGSWAYGYYNSLHKDYYQSNIGVLPAFQTSDIFILVSDSFTLPDKSRNFKYVKNLLQIITQKKLQIDTSNRWGSIPARKDISIEKLNQFSAHNFRTFYNSKQLASIAHGSAIKEPLTSVLHDQLISFLSGQDEKKTSKNIMEYALKFGLE